MSSRTSDPRIRSNQIRTMPLQEGSMESKARLSGRCHSGRTMLDVVASRRQFLIATAGGAAAVSLPMVAVAVESEKESHNPNQMKGKQCMNRITTKDGTEIYFKDWGSGRPVVFSHGWPLSADAWEDQMFFLVSRGFRCIAHDRRGHGRSSQPWHGNDFDTYADDLHQLITHLEIDKAVLVGHSMGGGEVVRYIARHGSARVAKAVIIGAIAPV